VYESDANLHLVTAHYHARVDPPRRLRDDRAFINRLCFLDLLLLLGLWRLFLLHEIHEASNLLLHLEGGGGIYLMVEDFQQYFQDLDEKLSQFSCIWLKIVQGISK